MSCKLSDYSVGNQKANYYFYPVKNIQNIKSFIWIRNMWEMNKNCETTLKMTATMPC